MSNCSPCRSSFFGVVSAVEIRQAWAHCLTACARCLAACARAEEAYEMSNTLLVTGIACMGFCFCLPVLKCAKDAAASAKEDGDKDDKSKGKKKGGP